MTLPDDLIDPAEVRLMRGVRTYTEAAVVPVDPVAIAAAAAATGRARNRGRTGLFGRFASRLVLVGATAAIATAALVALIGPGAQPRQTAAAPSPGLTSDQSGLPAAQSCTFHDVDAAITNWSGAAGSRVATVELMQLGPNSCLVDSQPGVDLVGVVNGQVTHLIVGAAASGSPIDFRPGDLLYTQVAVSNYCGPDPEAPVTLDFGTPTNGYTAAPLTPTDLSGVPPCNGPNQPAHIEMHPWSAQVP